MPADKWYMDFADTFNPCNSVPVDENTAYRVLALYALDRGSLSVSQIMKRMQNGENGWSLTTGAKIYANGDRARKFYPEYAFIISGYDHVGIDTMTAVLAW